MESWSLGHGQEVLQQDLSILAPDVAEIAVHVFNCSQGLSEVHIEHWKSQG